MKRERFMCTVSWGNGIQYTIRHFEDKEEAFAFARNRKFHLLSRKGARPSIQIYEKLHDEIAEVSLPPQEKRSAS